MQKDRAQVFNPRTQRWVKIDTKRGGIVAHKKTPGPYKDVKRLRPKKPKKKKAPTVSQLRKYHERKRGKHAVKVDKRKQAKQVFSRADKKGVRKWRKAPQRYDIRGVDTKVKQAKKKSKKAIQEGKDKVRRARSAYRQKKKAIKKKPIPKKEKKARIQVAKTEYKETVKKSTRTVKEKVAKAFEPVRIAFKKPWTRERKRRARYVSKTTGASVIQSDHLIARAESRGEAYDTMDWDAIQGRDLSHHERVDKMDRMIGRTTTPSQELYEILNQEAKFKQEYEDWARRQEV